MPPPLPLPHLVVATSAAADSDADVGASDGACDRNSTSVASDRLVQGAAPALVSVAVALSSPDDSDSVQLHWSPEPAGEESLRNLRFSVRTNLRLLVDDTSSVAMFESPPASPTFFDDDLALSADSVAPSTRIRTRRPTFYQRTAPSRKSTAVSRKLTAAALGIADVDTFLTYLSVLREDAGLSALDLDSSSSLSRADTFVHSLKDATNPPVMRPIAKFNRGTIDLSSRGALTVAAKFHLAKLCIEACGVYQLSDVQARSLKDEGFAILVHLTVDHHLIEPAFYLAKSFAEDGNYQFALPLFRCAADADHIESSFAAASYLESGKGCHASVSSALLYYMKSAKAGYLHAMHRIATALFIGQLTLPRDVRDATVWLEKCANYPSREPLVFRSITQLVQVYSLNLNNAETQQHDDYIRAVRRLENADPDETYVPAMSVLAHALEHSVDAKPRDAAKAVRLYLRAAELRDPYAMWVVADYHLCGTMVVECSCPGFGEDGDALYGFDEIVPRLEDMVDVWNFDATSTSTDFPAPSLPNIFLETTHTANTHSSGKCPVLIQVPKDVDKTITYLNGVAQSSSASSSLRGYALHALGTLYDSLIPEIKDPIRASEFYEAAAKAGNVEARLKMSDRKTMKILSAESEFFDLDDVETERFSMNDLRLSLHETTRLSLEGKGKRSKRQDKCILM
ncbi:hypothetical protein HDU84_005967 [Entophlyctis sp. JEL0112]|nr:hypothetical protein HDU84_005967 [Entophlyctis sp. JEL0112]